ncbi:hypothetical protein BKI51_22545 [Alphaproteobacteria bacterium AO1-B]|nr:hypothetical protein BKI51_22545 [Alphaproteobacteria bacterium AO1-B]
MQVALVGREPHLPAIAREPGPDLVQRVGPVRQAGSGSDWEVGAEQHRPVGPVAAARRLPEETEPKQVRAAARSAAGLVEALVAATAGQSAAPVVAAAVALVAVFVAALEDLPEAAAQMQPVGMPEFADLPLWAGSPPSEWCFAAALVLQVSPHCCRASEQQRAVAGCRKPRASHCFRQAGVTAREDRSIWHQTTSGRHRPEDWPPPWHAVQYRAPGPGGRFHLAYLLAAAVR